MGVRISTFVGVVVLAAASAVATQVATKTSERVTSPDPRFDLEKPFAASVTVLGPGITYELPDLLLGERADQLVAGAVDDEVAMAGFVNKAGGAPAGALELNLVVAGTFPGAIRITNIRLVAVKPSPLIDGTEIQMPSEGGGEDTIPLRVDMDDPRHLVNRLDGRTYFSTSNIDVGEKERVTLNMTFQAKKRSYRWLLEFDYLAPDNASRVAYVGYDGTTSSTIEGFRPEQQFSVTGRPARTGIHYQSNFPAPGYHVRN